MIHFDKTMIDFGGSVYTFENIAKLPKAKENAFLYSVKSICQSWTFDRMTQEEKERCIESLRFANSQQLVNGSYTQRMNQYNAIYHAYLLGIGYDNLMDWREK